MYEDILIERYDLHPNVAKEFSTSEDFDLIDGYKDSVKPFIVTGIKMTDYAEPIEKAFQSRLQIILSSALLRSILLKNGAVRALNESNFPAFYGVLKSFLEVPALLGYIVHLIYNSNDYKGEILPTLVKIYVGMKPAGSFSVGTTQAINVLTMFEKLDKVIKGIAVDGKTEEEKKRIQAEENIMTTFYSDVCNYGHVNWAAHLSVGILGKDSVWNAKTSSEGYKAELYGFYMIPFVVGIRTTQAMCSMLMRNDKVREFDLIRGEGRPMFP